MSTGSSILHQSLGKQCYHHTQFCNPEEGWECETCATWFCIAHPNYSSKGHNVECVRCERNRVEAELQRRTRKAEYKWSDPYHWFLDWIDKETDPKRLRAHLRFIASRLEADQVQDLFQTEMEADGYFKAMCQ